MLVQSNVPWSNFGSQLAYGFCMFSSLIPLTEPPVESPIADGMVWIQQAALGPIATTIAVIAVAAIGLLMLSGRLELRRGITVAIGCFIIFGASIIPSTLIEPSIDRENARLDREALSDNSQSTGLPHSAYDPYAGASVPASR